MLGPHRDDEFFDRERLRVVARGCFVRTPRVENKVELARTQVLPEVEFHGSQRRAYARCLLENIDRDGRVAVPRADEEGRTPKMPQVHDRRTEASLVTSKRNGLPRPTVGARFACVAVVPAFFSFVPRVSDVLRDRATTDRRKPERNSARPSPQSLARATRLLRFGALPDVP